ESVRAYVLFRNMRLNHSYFAVVVDEYGGVQGIVTMNDLVSQLVGVLDDGPDVQDSWMEIKQLPEGVWQIGGGAPLDEVSAQLAIALPVDKYATFGGLIFSTLTTIPADGSCFELDICGIHIQAAEIKNHRLEKCMVKIASPNPGQE
ncbi:MAG: transporter associated domain-containing protein, partial [Clostridiales bacterium]